MNSLTQSPPPMLCHNYIKQISLTMDQSMSSQLKRREMIVEAEVVMAEEEDLEMISMTKMPKIIQNYSLVGYKVMKRNRQQEMLLANSENYQTLRC